MQVLVINCGSSSLKLDVLDSQTGERAASEKVERLDGTHEEAIAALLPGLLEGREVRAVAHRVVHGGERFIRPTLVDDAVMSELEALVPLAPLHLPANLAGLRAARERLPDLPHVAVFDTAFHSTLPNRARRYALPLEFADQHGIRRYGFHGTSHQWVAQRAAEYLHSSPRDLRVITCHLGNGCSVTAVEYGRSVETSMGMTPLEGLVMGTRSGDLDAGVILQLMRAEGLDVDGLDELLNRKSGLAGLSGVGNDMRDIEARAAEGDERSRAALAVFTHRIRKYIGAYAAVMGGVDAIVFTGGIGENSALVRHRVAQRLEFLGAVLDEDANRAVRVDRADPVGEFSARHSRCRLLVVATDEAHAMARDAAEVVDQVHEVTVDRSIPIAVSARHVHLSREAIDALFGEGYQLTPRTALSQPGQFATVERVTLVGPKRSIENVVIVGPERKETQVEISRTDEFVLGIDAPIRCSGDLENTPGITMVGPKGSYTIERGVIQSQRHIHMHPDDAAYFGVKDRDVVEVEIDSEGRDTVFRDVVVRVHPSYKLEMHVDTDEGNAVEYAPGIHAVLLETRDRVHVTRRS